ncbi:hypothetical protein [Streptomyces sp. YS-3]|uniref:hypothetical protein n=1 Tax=Streptomyces sp. YS-3 TaxID=3381352 RepID=UPI003862962E
MVTESPRAAASSADELLGQVRTLRQDADLMGAYARRLLATAAALGCCPAAPEWSRATLEQQAAACATAAEQLRTAAAALFAHVRG